MHGRGRRRRQRAVLGSLYVGALLVTAILAVARPAAYARSPAENPESQQDPPPTEAPDSGEPAAAPRRPVRAASLVEADRFIDRMIDGEPVSVLIGNVYIDRDSLTARADTGYYYRVQGFYELIGNVQLRQNEAVLTCDRAIYWRDEEAADFFGNVRLVDDESIGTSERGESRDNGGLFRLIGNALLDGDKTSNLASQDLLDAAVDVIFTGGTVDRINWDIIL